MHITTITSPHPTVSPIFPISVSLIPPLLLRSSSSFFTLSQSVNFCCKRIILFFERNTQTRITRHLRPIHKSWHNGVEIEKVSHKPVGNFNMRPFHQADKVIHPLPQDAWHMPLFKIITLKIQKFEIRF